MYSGLEAKLKEVQALTRNSRDWCLHGFFGKNDRQRSNVTSISCSPPELTQQWEYPVYQWTASVVWALQGAPERMTLGA